MSTNAYAQCHSSLSSLNVIYPPYKLPTTVASLLPPTTLPVPCVLKSSMIRNTSHLYFLCDAQTKSIFKRWLLCFFFTKASNSIIFFLSVSTICSTLCTFHKFTWSILYICLYFLSEPKTMTQWYSWLFCTCTCSPHHNHIYSHFRKMFLMITQTLYWQVFIPCCQDLWDFYDITLFIFFANLQLAVTCLVPTYSLTWINSIHYSVCWVYFWIYFRAKPSARILVFCSRYIIYPFKIFLQVN